MKKVCTRWVQKLLTLLQHANPVNCYEKLQENYNHLTGLFGRIVMGDEIWILHYDLLNQQEAKIWKKTGEKIPVRLRVTR